MEAFLQGESVKSVGVAAMLLALTRTLKDEETAKRALTEVGHKFVVTEVGGKTSYDDFHEKVNRAVIGASLNSGIIEKTANDIHALIHATEEAKKGILTGNYIIKNINNNFRQEQLSNEKNFEIAYWVLNNRKRAGRGTDTYMTNHERAGLGVMHI